MQEHLKVWFEAYDGWQKALHDVSLDYGQAEEKWFDAIESITGSLWKNVIGPVYGALKPLKPEQVFLIPTGLLSLIPLHAAWRDEGGKREYLQDLLPVSYVPSARALVHARRTARAASAEKLLAIDEPKLLKPSPLPNSHAEVLAISSLFKNPKTLEHEKATRSAALQALPSAQVAHFSCHGGANWSDPEQSGLLMANNEILTIKDLFELHLYGARLATLSACETGVPGTKLPDEVVSLPSAFIRAGFAGAIGSLWTVSDESTAQLMTSFYQLWRVKGMPPVQALAEAQKRLRDSEKFQHPFYWAAFYLTGV
jgi:CHAT domain-containing protein